MSRQDILDLYAFLEWIMVLPEELGKQLYNKIEKYEEERKMKYVTVAERIGMEKGIQKGKREGEISTWRAVLQTVNIPEELAARARQRLDELTRDPRGHAIAS